jgi:uncharacterized membrane protein YGL010W
MIFLEHAPIISDYLPTSVTALFPGDFKLTFTMLFALRYILYYAFIEQPGIAGLIAVALVLYGYQFAVNAVQTISYVWQPALAVHIFCWVAQFYGHFAHEKRAPALFDNLFQALVLAPLFVLMEVLFMFGYKRDFQKRVNAIVQKNIAEFRAQEAKKAK